MNPVEFNEKEKVWLDGYYQAMTDGRQMLDETKRLYREQMTDLDCCRSESREMRENRDFYLELWKKAQQELDETKALLNQAVELLVACHSDLCDKDQPNQVQAQKEIETFLAQFDKEKPIINTRLQAEMEKADTAIKGGRATTLAYMLDEPVEKILEVASFDKEEE